MSMHWRTALAAAVAVAVSAPGAKAEEWTRDSAGNILVPPAPNVAEKLFNPIDEARDPACPKKGEVILHYILSASDLKSGNVKLLAGELPQLFSDNWRRRLRMPTIRVSAVVAQPIDLSPLGGGAALDVTEFDADGCAFSRTIMPAAMWGEMLRAVAGVSA